MDSKQKEENALRWQSTGLLSGLEDRNVMANLAVLLENQRRQNENYDGEEHALFKRLSIPLVRRAYGEAFIGWNIVSVQSALSTEPLVYNIDKYNNVQESVIACKGRNLHSYIPLVKVLGEVDGSKFLEHKLNGYENYRLEGPHAEKLQRSYHVNLDFEAELTALVSCDLCNELNAEIIHDLSTHARTKTDHLWKSRDHFVEALVMLASVCERESRKPPNWFVLSENLAKEVSFRNGYEPYDGKSVLPVNVKRVGTLLGRWAIYSDSLSSDKALCGYRGGIFDAGYQYCPFIPLVETEQVLEKENVSRKRLYMRYGKRMWHNGYYAAMKVEDFQPTEEKDDE